MNKDTTTNDEKVTKRTQRDEDTEYTQTTNKNKNDDSNRNKKADITKTVKNKVPLTDNSLITLGLVICLGLIFVLYYIFGNNKGLKDIQLNEESFISKFNKKRHDYSIRLNSFFEGMSLHQVSELFKATLGDHKMQPLCNSFDLQAVVIPEHYNFYDQHPNCRFSEFQQKSFNGYVEILASTFRNRYCVLHMGKDFSPSVNHLLTCDIEKNRVKSGELSKVLDYVKKYGFIAEQCWSSLKKVEGKCVSDSDLKKCERIEMTNFCYLNDATKIKKEIFMNGPVISVMDLHQNFLLYEKGIYDFNNSRKLEGQVFVKIVGWGVDSKKNEYWLVESSFGKNWAENGLAKIKIGLKESTLDNIAVAVYPKVPEARTETK